jgi:hypothetical protein
MIYFYYSYISIKSVTYLISKSNLFRPQMKHLSDISSSIKFLLSLMSANASIIIPKIKFSIRMITIKKKERSKTNLGQYKLFVLSNYSIASPIPPPFLSPTFRVEVKHDNKVSQ